MSNNFPEKIEGILFDLDGTLLDTAGDLGAALNYVLKKHNLAPLPEEAYRPVVSDGALGLLTLGFGKKLADYNYDNLRAELLEYYQQNIAENTFLYPHIPELLKALDKANIPWGIITNKPEDLSLKLIPHFPELATSKILLGGDSLAERKPHPMPMYYACDKLNINPENAIYVGDAPRDIQAGNGANMYTIAALWGYILDTTICHQWGADYLATTPAQITEFIL